jgi:protein-disulfide isomerase
VDSITLSKSTFYKIVIVGVIALMVSAFFAGFNLHGFTNPVTYLTVPSALPASQVPGALSPTTSPESFPEPTPISVKNLTLGDSPFLGQAEANVALVEYADFQCPFCETFFSNDLSEIKKEYVDTGKIKFVFKHLPLEFHPNAKPAAIASECANEQGKFWPFHDSLFSNQSSWQDLGGNQTNAEFVK